MDYSEIILCELNEYGVITGIMRVGQEKSATQFEEMGWVRVDRLPDPEREYVINGKITDRPVMEGFDKSTIKADGVDCVNLTGLVPTAKVWVQDNTEIIMELFPKDGTLTLTSRVPKKLTIVVDNHPYQLLQQDIEAV